MRKNDIVTDEWAWADLLLSKAALIIASIVVLAALYHFYAEMGSVERDMQLDTMAQDLRSAIDAASSKEQKPYSFDSYRLGAPIPNVSISGEYVCIEENGKRHVKALTYRTLVLTEDTLREKLSDTFLANGSSNEPIPASYEDITVYLSTLGTKEQNINTSTEVHIKKTLIYIYDQNDTKVKGLEYVLVHQ